MPGKTLFRVNSDALITFLLLVLSVMPVIAESTDKNAPAAWVDRDNFPQAYGILSSEHLMFPDNVSNLPIKIDSKRQLFIDDYMIASTKNITRQFHQPTKHPANPLMNGYVPNVLYNQQRKKFRMWCSMNYSQSDDGVHWTKLYLGPDGGSRLIKNACEPRGFIYDADTTDPQARYKVVFFDRKAELDNDGLGGYYLYCSPDGIHWKPSPKNPVIEQVSHYKRPGPYWSYNVGDTTTFRYDSVLKRYICDAKMVLNMPQTKIKSLELVLDRKKDRIRLRTMLESEDFVHWTRPRFFLAPDRNDQRDGQIYGHMGYNYESMWFGLIRLMHMIPEGFKQVDIHLSYSRDGRHWSRPRQRQPFIPLGDANSWEADYSGYSFTRPLLLNDKLWFYYFGSRNGKRDNLKHWGACYIGLAKLRRDGFASLDAGQDVGQITTRPMTFAGKKLFVNADVEKDGWIKAAILKRDSNSIESYTLDDSIALTKDTTKGRMSWKSKRELVPPGDKHLRFVFQLKNTKLYSFWIE